MGRELQKKKNRSSLHRVKSTPRGRTKAGKKKVNFLGNAIIAENWDRSLTLTQNYKHLGLSSRLNAPTGGVEKKVKKTSNATEAETPADPLAITSIARPKTIKPTEARVERDPTTGKILRVIRAEDKEDTNPLNDPLNNISKPLSQDETLSPHGNGVVADLEAQVQAESQKLERERRPRQQSKREGEWIERLVGKYGDDYRAMSRDRKLNPMQQTEGDIKRRVQTWEKKSGVT